MVGLKLGVRLGFTVLLSCSDGYEEFDGLELIEGDKDGTNEGKVEGWSDGLIDGCAIGEDDGLDV